MKKNSIPPTLPNPEADKRTRRVELLISNLLRFGVAASLVLVTLGVVISYAHNPAYFSSPAELQQITRTGTVFPSTLRDVMTGLWNLQGDAIIVAGLLLLIATPITRVAISVLAFVYQKDRIYTLITIGVLCLLILSFVLGKVE